MENFLNVNFLTTFYFWLAVIMTAFFLVKLVIFSLFGMDDGEGDLVGTDVDEGFNFISLQSIIAFLMGFGWMGYAALKSFNMNQLATFGSAFGVGLIFMLGTAYLMMLVKKLEKTVKKDKTTAIDKVGKAYTDFAPNGQGRIEIEVNGQLTVAEAINNTDTEIKSFEAVKVVKVENDLLYIEKVI